MTAVKMNNNLLLFFIFITLGQVFTWFQVNSQFISSNFSAKNWLMLLAGIPISWLYMEATRHGVTYFSGHLWAQRLIGFSVGIVSYATLSHYFLGEKLDLKTITCIFLALSIVLIQFFWKDK